MERVRESPLYVFFPTEKQTQFGFLIQGPYRTTPARDNVPKDDAWNATLVDTTAALIVEALHEIKARGLLTVATLNTLPIRLDAFNPDAMFFPIVAAVRDALRTTDLLPAEDGTYVAASNAKLGRAPNCGSYWGRINWPLFSRPAPRRNGFPVKSPRSGRLIFGPTY